MTGTIEEMDEAELREQVGKFRRLLNPVWMRLAYLALGGNGRPADGDTIFYHMGGGCSDASLYGDFYELMGDPWAIPMDGDDSPSAITKGAVR